MDFRQLLFQLIQKAFLRKGKKLNNKTSGLSHGIFLIHQNTKPNGRRNLLTDTVVSIDILGNFPTD